MGRFESDNERELFYWLALYMAPGVGAVRFHRLLEYFQNPEAVFKARASDLAQVQGISSQVREAIRGFNWESETEKQIVRAEEMGVALIKSKDPEYPVRLKAIHDPPPLLWVKGRLEKTDQAAVAIVGSRGATEYGREVSARLASELASAGVCIVSGMALGIDSAAHTGALAAGGRTYAILGCGVDILYPKPNRDLFERIPEHGAVISEFSLGTPPEPGHFPRRNRVISGLSLGVVVVEAGERSGSLITARMALEQNREVFAVPGRVASMKTKGTHTLLKQGACLVETGRDVLDEIAPQIGVRKFQAKIIAPEKKLPGKKGRIWDAVEEEPLHVDKLGRIIDLAPDKLATILLEMELEGHIRQLPGMRYTRA